MSLSTVAIVGRPNVGKSSLLNMLAGRRISIVEPTAGVTRDRIQATCEHEGTYFDLVDTGGYGLGDRDDLGAQIERQIALAVEQAALILFVADGREGVTPLDQSVADWLRRCERPVLLVANKVDADNAPTELGELARLGFGEPLAVSALHRRGLHDIREWIARHLPATAAPPEPVMRLAIVGRRNAGKSTFLNALAGQERVIVSEVPGTTRDAVDVRFELDGHTYVAIDTAGVRKKGKIADDIEYYGSHRAELSIRRADVVLLLIDATEEVGSVDKHLGGYIAGQYKPCILVVNKWDLVQKDTHTTEEYKERIRREMKTLDYVPILFISALTGQRASRIFQVIDEVVAEYRKRITTGELNTWLREAVQSYPPPAFHNRPVKLLFISQVSVAPPTFVLFVNEPMGLGESCQRYLLRRLREKHGFAGTPLRLFLKKRKKEKT